MAFLEVKKVKIAGISACVPSGVEETFDYDLLPREMLEKYVESVGVLKKHRAKEDQCTSDLCCEALKN